MAVKIRRSEARDRVIGMANYVIHENTWTLRLAITWGLQMAKAAFGFAARQEWPCRLLFREK